MEMYFVISVLLSISTVAALSHNGYNGAQTVEVGRMFAAPAPPQPDSLSFLVLGDWGGLPDFPYKTPIEQAVASRLSALATQVNASFVLALGDNFYFDGVTSVEDPRFQETYNSVFTQTSCDLEWYLIAGNHDWNGNISAQVEYSKLEKRWMYPSLYYTQQFAVPGPAGAHIDIVMTDSIVLCGNSDHDFLGLQPSGPADSSAAETQWAWLEQQLSASTAEYLVVGGHYPVYSIAEHGPTACLVDRLMPLLHKYGVTAYLNGHDHNLQHLQTSVNNHTVDYFVSGAANFVDPVTKHRASVPAGSSKFFWGNIVSLGGLSYMRASADNMTFTFVEANGKELYTQAMPPRRF